MEQQTPISREDFRHWLEDRVTQRLMWYLKHQREESKEAWACNALGRPDHDDAVQVGKCIAWESIIKVTAEDIEPSLLNQGDENVEYPS